MVFLGVCLIKIVGGHSESLGDRNQEVQHIHNLDARVLGVEFLVFSPPFPRDGIHELRVFLREGAAII